MPVLNDREGLRELLPRLTTQTLQPCEIIVVDGGSVDGTLEVLGKLDLSPASVRTIVVPGANIARGRNLGVQAAQSQFIACTDAGCLPDPGWLRALREELERADVVGGVVVVEGQTPFERLLALTHYPVPEEADNPNPLVALSHRLFGRGPLTDRTSGGSMAFRREVWQLVGGFPEHQHAGEDHAFGQSIRDRGFRLGYASGAIVRWRPPSTVAGNARMFYSYCRGDVRSRGRGRHLLRATGWTVGSLTAFKGGRRSQVTVAAIACADMALPLWRARQRRVPATTWWQVPLLVALKDIAQIIGAAHGALDALRRVPQPIPKRPSRTKLWGDQVPGGSERVSPSP